MKKKRELNPRERLAWENLKRIWHIKKSELGLTQEKMAHLLGFSNQSGFGRFIQGKEALYTDVIVAIAKILKVTVHEIDPEFEIPPHTKSKNPYAIEAFSDFSEEEQREALEFIAFRRQMKARNAAHLEVAAPAEKKS